jgi:CRP-like cAMP-binding protein
MRRVTLTLNSNTSRVTQRKHTLVKQGSRTAKALHQGHTASSSKGTDNKDKLRSGSPAGSDGSGEIVATATKSVPHTRVVSHESFFLPKLKSHAMTVMDENPFFKGISEELKHEFNKVLVRLHLSEMSKTHHGADILGLDRHGVFGASVTTDFEYHETSQIRNLIVQDQDIPAELDGLIITDSHFDSDLELTFHGHTVGAVRSKAVVGAEVLLGLARRPPFGLRLHKEPRVPASFIPRKDFLSILAREEFADDKDLLHLYAEDTSSSMLHNWCCQNVPRVKIRLFMNASGVFRSLLLKAMSFKLHAGGSIILKEGDVEPSCIFVYHGEAEVVLLGHHVCQLQHIGPHTTAWSSWWAVLEATGASHRRPAAVAAVTDCAVWYLEGSALKSLRDDFPSECSCFDKVAIKHVKLLSQYAMDFFHVPLLRECDPNFLAHLSCVCTQRICSPGDYIVKEDDHGTEMFLLARGQASVYRAGTKLACQSEGACFGELAVLGIASRRTASIICETVCDLRVLDRSNLLKALTHFPKESDRMQRVAEAHGYSRKLAIDELEHLQTLQGFSSEFVQQLTEHFYEQAFFLGQTLVKQDVESYEMFVITSGTVALEVSGTQCGEVEGPAVICETALIDPGSRATATVRCLTVCACFAIHTKMVAHKFQKDFPEDLAKLKAMAKSRQDEMAANLLEKFNQLGIDDGDAGEDGEKAESREKPEIKLGSAGSFFADSDLKFLGQLSQHLEKRVYFDGQAMLQEGEAGDYALLINDGTGIVELSGERVSEIKRGNFVGEVVLLGFAETYSCTIRAMGLVTAFSVNKAKFQEVMESFPDEKKRLEDLMKQRVKLTRTVTKVRAFCNFVSPSKADGDDKADDLLGHLKGRRSSSGGMNHRSSLQEKIIRRTQSIQSSGSLSRSSVPGISDGRRRSSIELLLFHKENRGMKERSSRRPSMTSMASMTSNVSRTSIKEGGHDEEADIPTSRTTDATSCTPSVRSPERSPRGRYPQEPHPTEEEVEDQVDRFGEAEDGDITKEPDQISIQRQVRVRRSEGRRWVAKRKEAIQKASWRRRMNLKRRGLVSEELPPDCSYRLEGAANASLGDFDEEGKNKDYSRAPISRFDKASSVYGRPVWHEVFGSPIDGVWLSR